MATRAPSSGSERVRSIVLGLAMGALAILILQHLYWYQVADQASLTSRATEEHESRRELPAQRGGLFDRNGYPLAVTVTYHAVYVYAPYVRDVERTAKRLSEILAIPAGDVLDLIRTADRHWNLVAARISADAVARLEAAGLPGVDVRPISVRDYPEGSLAAQVLGFVGKDGAGLSGLELTLDDDLQGKPGLLVTERDTDGGEIALARKQLVPPVPGSNVFLTLDRTIQRLAERRLAEGVRDNKAIGGVAIVIEPTTGALLALASQPSFTLSTDLEVDPKNQYLYKPTAVTDTYEPGSVMKLATVAGAIEERAVGPETRYFDSGEARIDGVPIYNWDHNGYGSVSVRQILIYSLNTGAQWVAGQLGADRFYHYLDAFGFGEPTGVPLNGEASGWFRRPGDPIWSRLDLATNAFGQSIAATPLQVITAIASFGNEGVRLHPQLVREIRGPTGARTIEPRPAQRVVSAETANTMLDLMASVWNQPALQAQRIPGYSLAAKSGTADIPGIGGYNLGKTYASFVALGPLPDPRFAILVRIDQPATTWGGTAAAPVVRALAADLLSYLAIPPDKVGGR